MLLTSILCVPLMVGLACLFARPAALVESLNICGFVVTLVRGVGLLTTVLASNRVPLGTLLLFTAWLPASLSHLTRQAASIIRGVA